MFPDDSADVEWVTVGVVRVDVTLVFKLEDVAMISELEDETPTSELEDEMLISELEDVDFADAELVDVEVVSCRVVWYAVTVVPLPSWQP